MDSGILMIQDSILVCSPDPRILHTADGTKTQTIKDFLWVNHQFQVCNELTKGKRMDGTSLLCLKQDLLMLTHLIQDFCSTNFKLIYNTQEQRNNYCVANKAHPSIVATAPSGGATAKHADYLVAMLLTDIWAYKVVTRFTFDQNAEHPNAVPAQASKTSNTCNSKQDNNSVGLI
jgi:hypothetical protein